MLVNFEVTESSISLPKKTNQKEMLSVRKEGNKTMVRINSSSLAIIQECLRKSKYVLAEGWKSETESPATVFGSAIHKALEIYYSGDPSERTMPKLEDLELMSYGHPMPDYGLVSRAIKGFVEKASPLAALPAEDKRSVQNGVWTLWNYFKAFIDDPYVAYRDENGAFVERSFSYKLYSDSNLEIEYFGTIDVVLKHIKKDELLVADHKTSSVVGNDFYARLKPNHQYTGYLLAAKEVFGIDTDSFMVNCLQVKQRPTTARGLPPHFPRQITTRDEDDFADFKDSVVSAVRSFLYAYSTNIFPIGHVNACASYAGCQFLNVCAAPKKLRENILRSKYVKGEIDGTTE